MPNILNEKAMQGKTLPKEVSEDSCSSSSSSISKDTQSIMTPLKNQDKIIMKEILHDNILPYLNESPIKTSML